MAHQGRRIIPGFIIVAVVLLGMAIQDGPKKNLTYQKDIEPIVEKYCLPCHLTENENPSGLVMDNYELLMKGGEHGKSVISGKPKDSYLYLKLLPDPPFGKQMPRGRRKPSDEDLIMIHDWIEQGAKKE